MHRARATAEREGAVGHASRAAANLRRTAGCHTTGSWELLPAAACPEKSDAAPASSLLCAPLKEYELPRVPCALCDDVRARPEAAEGKRGKRQASRLTDGGPVGVASGSSTAPVGTARAAPGGGGGRREEKEEKEEEEEKEEKEDPF